MNPLHIRCPHFETCSGCSLNENVDRLSLLKEARDFFLSLGVSSFELQVGNPQAWRCRAKLAVRGSVSAPRIGLFEKGSHQVSPIPNCRVHHPAINKAVVLLKQWMVQHQIEPYDEALSKGLLRYIQLAVERKTGRVQLVLVLNDKKANPRLLQMLEKLWEKDPNVWHSLWLNFNTRQDNIIFGVDWTHLYGEVWLFEALNGQEVAFHPSSFAQANLEMFERLLQRLEQMLPEQADLLEFYAGVGAIGLALVKKCRRLRCVEINPLAALCFEETVKHLPVELKNRLSFVRGKSADFTDFLKSIDPASGVIIVDPPRKGLEKGLLEALCTANEAGRLVYVSCGWPGFQRDCNRLLEAGWLLVHAEAFLFFPGSDHLEVLAIFEKKE